MYLCSKDSIELLMKKMLDEFNALKCAPSIVITLFIKKTHFNSNLTLIYATFSFSLLLVVRFSSKLTKFISLRQNF